MLERDAGDCASLLAAELVRFIRLTGRAKGMLHAGDLGAELSALMLRVGPLRVTDLAEVKQADPSTVSRQVAQLVKAGLARREADPVDGRASRLAITDMGVSACQKLHGAGHALLSEALRGWPPERVAAFADLFEEFNSSVEGHLRDYPAASATSGAGSPGAMSPQENT